MCLRLPPGWCFTGVIGIHGAAAAIGKPNTGIFCMKAGLHGQPRLLYPCSATCKQRGHADHIRIPVSLASLPLHDSDAGWKCLRECCYEKVSFYSPLLSLPSFQPQKLLKGGNSEKCCFVFSENIDYLDFFVSSTFCVTGIRKYVGL